MLNSMLSDADSVVGMETQLEEGWEAFSASKKLEHVPKIVFSLSREIAY